MTKDKDREAFSGKTTFICFWASMGSSYNIIEACDLTYERRIVAVVEELDKESNRLLAERICLLLNRAALDTSQEVVEALEFYADPSDYVAPYTGGLGKLYFDCGEKAKQALAKHKQKGG